MRRGYESDPTASDSTVVHVTAEKRMARSLGAPVWRISGRFPFTRQVLAESPDVVDEQIVAAILGAIAKGPQGPVA